MTDVLQLLPTIFLFLVAVFFIITIIVVFRQFATMKSLLENQAAKRGGTVERKYTSRFLKFLYHDFSVVVSVRQGSRYQPPETKVSIVLHKPVPSSVSIYHESLASRIGKAFGSQDIQSGSDEFDNAFMVKADDELFVRNLVNMMIQNKLLDMKKDKPHILLKGTTLDIFINKVLKTDEQYDQLIDLAIALLERIQEVQ